MSMIHAQHGCARHSTVVEEACNKCNTNERKPKETTTIIKPVYTFVTRAYQYMLTQILIFN